jgi:hypothetical protein
MWNLYLKTNEGIAIQSTYELLDENLDKSEKRIFSGPVNYVDYEIDTFRWDIVFNPFMHKRKSFEHEKELRAIIWEEQSEEIDGIKVKVNLSSLIQNVYLCPDSPPWFSKLVVDTIDKFDLKLNVIQSKLLEDPLY